MSLFLKFAMRNTSRNAKTTLLNGIGISFLAIILLIILSLSAGIEHYIIRNNIKFETGAVSIAVHKDILSYNKKAFGDSLLQMIESTLEKNQKIVNYTFRIYPPNALVYLESNTQSVNLVGLVEEEIKFLPEMLKMLEGNNISHGSNIVVSNGLASEYGLKVGDVCNIMLQSVDGTINLEEFIISGIFRYTSLSNKFNVYMDYSQAMNLYHANLPSKILIDLKDLATTRDVKDELKRELQRYAGDNLDKENAVLEISSYEDHVGMAKALSNFNKYGMMSIAFFLIFISFVGIWSMQTENKTKRRKETGTLLSFGFSSNAIRTIYVYESLYVAVLYTIVGVFVASIVILVISANDGLYLGESASFAFGSSIILPHLTWKDILITLSIGILYPLLATSLSVITFNKNIVNLLK